MNIEQRLALMADETEIRNALACLAQNADQGKPEYIDTYTDDAVWDGGDDFGVYRGARQIMDAQKEKWSKGIAGPGTNLLHVVTTSTVEVKGDQAQARSYLLVYVDCNATPRVTFAGIYLDRFRRTFSGWKVEYRSLRRV
jgi:hypothetical protein